VAYVKDDLGFDAAVDHRASGFAAELAAACPDGIDIYFENVGGRNFGKLIVRVDAYKRVIGLNILRTKHWALRDRYVACQGQTPKIQPPCISRSGIVGTPRYHNDDVIRPLRTESCDAKYSGGPSGRD
jgi:hypothetical protein